MIDEMLIDAAGQGYSPEDIKESVVKILDPYFEHADSLRKYACDSQLLSGFEFFIRYHHDTEFAEGVKLITDFYKDVNKRYNKEFWNIILSTYALMVEDENKMWSIRKNKINLQEEDLYENIVQIFRQIGNILEVSAKHIVQELYALIYLYNNGHVDYEKIRKQDFGVVINNIFDKGLFYSILNVEPYGMKLSDWRNIAFHHTYSFDGKETINCTYGKGNQNSICISMQELEQCAYKIIRSCNILNIARCIFIFDYMDDIPKKQSLENATFRQAIQYEQFRIGLLSQEFKLENVVLSEKKIEIDLRDLSTDIDQKRRVIHCSQLLLNTWNVWKRESVCINYIDCLDRKVCSVYVDGDICNSIYEGREELAYLANRFEFKYY